MLRFARLLARRYLNHHVGTQAAALANFIKTYPQSFAVMSQVGEVVGNFKNLSSSGKEVSSMLDSGDGKTL